MKQRLFAATAGVLLAFMLTGTVWVGVARLVPVGVPHSVAVVVIGFGFLVVYAGLLVLRVRSILSTRAGLLKHGVLAAVEVTAMLVAFGSVYHHLGVMDNTQAGTPVIHDYWISVYYSVVTFTTLGYGDYYPVGIGRALAGMQALTGYIILGLLASTTARVVSPHSKAGRTGAERSAE